MTIDSNLLRKIRLIGRVADRAAAKSVPIASDTYIPTYLGVTTPGVTTYTTQVGWYTRIERIIIAWGQVIWTAATGTGNAVVSLPFAATTDTNAAFAGAVDLLGVTFTNSTPIAELVATGTGFVMRSPLTNANGAVVAVEAAGRIIFTIVYAVD